MMITKIFQFLTLSEKRRFFLIVTILLISSLIETLGITSILPFIYLVSNPEYFLQNKILNIIFLEMRRFGISTSEQFLFFCGLFVFLFLIFSLFCRAFSQYLINRFAYMRESSIGVRLIKTYLSQPYIWFVDRNSSDISRNILSNVSIVIQQSILPIMTIISNIILVSALILLLFFIEAAPAIYIGLILFFSYFIIYIFIKKIIKNLGQKSLKANQERFFTVSNSFNLIKEVKIGNLEKLYINRFEKFSTIFAKTNSYSVILGQLPRFIIEGVAFGGMILLILLLISRGGQFINIIPILALYAIVGYRLIPAFQNIYESYTRIKFSNEVLDSIYNDLIKLKIADNSIDFEALPFNKKIELSNLNFSYPNSNRNILKNISLKIPVNSKVAIVGATGSGKTTLVDIILGLLDPNQGNLYIDDLQINNKNKKKWQKNIGYVPQQISLLDDSVTANIAYGVKKEDIDYKAVEKAAIISNIHNFITQKLPNQYETFLGEKGVKISGGERQRIGIARALYHKPKLLILDESTNSLDFDTEQLIIKEILNLDYKVTIVMITHRLNTIENFDTIFFIDSGKLQQISFQELSKNNELLKN